MIMAHLRQRHRIIHTAVVHDHVAIHDGEQMAQQVVKTTAGVNQAAAIK